MAGGSALLSVNGGLIWFNGRGFLVLVGIDGLEWFMEMV